MIGQLKLLSRKYAATSALSGLLLCVLVVTSPLLLSKAQMPLPIVMRLNDRPRTAVTGAFLSVGILATSGDVVVVRGGFGSLPGDAVPVLRATAQPRMRWHGVWVSSVGEAMSNINVIEEVPGWTSIAIPQKVWSAIAEFMLPDGDGPDPRLKNAMVRGVPYVRFLDGKGAFLELSCSTLFTICVWSTVMRIRLGRRLRRWCRFVSGQSSACPSCGFHVDQESRCPECGNVLRDSI